eukprot:2813664-Pyramimonas_sp.AAC.1
MNGTGGGPQQGGEGGWLGAGVGGVEGLQGAPTEDTQCQLDLPSWQMSHHDHRPCPHAEHDAGEMRHCGHRRRAVDRLCRTYKHTS